MDELDELIAEREQREPGFAAKVDAAQARLRKRAALGAALRDLRGDRTQTWVAAKMGTSESVVRRIEQGEDIRLSTLDKYAEALGRDLQIALA